MYACYDPFVVYGILESNRDQMLDREWLEENFTKIEMYASDVVRNHMGSAIYGYAVYLRPNGTATATEEQKADVQTLYDMICTYCASQDTEPPELGYFLAMSGDYEYEHEEYVPSQGIPDAL